MKRSYKDSTIKKLFGLSGNICAYSGCNHELITSDNIILADICHIEGGEQGSPRYNPELTLDQLNDYDNLILMCKIHHKIIDSDEIKYTVTELKNIKNNHENKTKPFEITPSQMQIIYQEFVAANQVIINKGEGNVVVSEIKHIGKESNNLDESEILGVNSDGYEIYENFDNIDEKFAKIAQKVLELKPRDVKGFGISKQTLWNIKKKITLRKITRISRKVKSLLLQRTNIE